MSYELEGTIKLISPAQTFGSGFQKREFVVTTAHDKYPQDIKLEFLKDKVALLDRFKEGQRVKVGFEIRGSEHNGRYYVNLAAWRIHPADEAGAGNQEGGQSQEPRSSGDWQSSGGPSKGPWQGAPSGGGGGGGNSNSGNNSGGGAGGGGGGRPAPQKKWDKPKGGRPAEEEESDWDRKAKFSGKKFNPKEIEDDEDMPF